ncbi:hypothetical protein C8T65DRAFT_588906, partial [Cerioporus squamosus]
MSTTIKNVHKTRGNARTSTEAAAAPQNLGATRFTVASELEALGELPGSFHLPPAEEEPPVRIYPGAPLHAATDIELGVKWGISNYDELMEDEFNRRLTRGSARALRTGQPAVTGGGTYRGHRGMRERPVAASEPEPERVPEAQHGEAVNSADEVAQSTEAESCAEEVAQFGEAEGSAKAVVQPEPASASDSDEEDARRVCAELDTASSPAEEWKVAVGGPARVATQSEGLTVASRYFPSWFDLSEVEDQLGPLPVEWISTATTVPVLPDLAPVNLSILDEILRDIAAARVRSTAEEDERSQLEMAIVASMRTAEDERIKREEMEGEIYGLTARAMIVTVDSDSEPEVPAGLNGRYSHEQKGKDVPRDAEQREFLRRFASCEPSSSGRTAKATGSSGPPKENRSGPAKPADRAKDKTVQFKRESSQMPEGGWFRATTAAGGRGPPSSSSSSSSSTSSSSDSDSSSSDSDDESSSSGSSSSSEYPSS